jgi:septal ring factor EnvC (AmiA/AmiB activator)
MACPGRQSRPLLSIVSKVAYPPTFGCAANTASWPFIKKKGEWKMRKALATVCIGAILLVGSTGWCQEKAQPAEAPKAKKSKPVNQKKIAAMFVQADKLLIHMKAIFKVLGDNADNCETAIKSINNYIFEHKKELQEVATEIKKMENKLTAEEKQAFEMQMQAKAQTMVQETMGTMMQFAQNCPNHVEQIGEALKFLEDPEKVKGPAKTK